MHLSEPLLSHIQKFVPLDPSEIATITPYLRYKKLEKKENLLMNGDICHANYFVAKGCLKMYVLKENGSEQIIQFAIDGWWLTDLNSFEMQRPSDFNIEAVEPTFVIYIEKNIQEELFEKAPKLEKYFRVVYQKVYATFQNRIYYIFCQSGEERYRHFSTCFPEFVQRIPLYMLASYLGFTPEFISKIRSRKK